jgi:exopolyphosphatase/guanosine-5'-triphosphate,3'-diphosphate pyrophosphatase
VLVVQPGVGASGRPVAAARPEETQPRPDARRNIAVDKGNGGRWQAGGNRQARGNTGFNRRPAYAALDLGTNNCRLLVAIPQAAGEFRVVDAFSRIVRLGEGLGQTGRLGAEAMERAIEALKICASKLQNRTITGQRLIATEACRRAENGALFLQRVVSETGLVLEIVDRETEARLAVSGCGPLVDRDAEGVVLFDIGGGSSELALLDTAERRGGRLADHIAAWTSMPLGVVTLSEKHGGGKHVTPKVFEAMTTEVMDLLHAFDGKTVLNGAADRGRLHLLGTSGTVTTLAGVHLELPRYDRRQVDGLWMHAHEVDAMTQKLLAMDFGQRVANPCIGLDRADLVLAGCAILEAIRRMWPCPKLRVADRGLREGLLSEMMAEDGVWRGQRRRDGRPVGNREPAGTGGWGNTRG